MQPSFCVTPAGASISLTSRINEMTTHTTLRLFRAPILCPSGGRRPARGREDCGGEPGSALSGGYAPDSAKAEGSSIVDEPGEG